MKNLDWFKKRVGKRIYRDAVKCHCSSCDDVVCVVCNGLTIADEDHAVYLYDNQNEFANEGIFLNYRDEKL